MKYKKVTLNDLINLDSGGAFKSKFFTENNGIPLIRIRNVSKGYSNTYYNGEYDKKYIVNKGDFLITMDGEFRINEWTGKKALLNQRVCRISVNSLELSSRYLLHFLPLALKKIEDKTPFVTVKHLSMKDIRNLKIPLPPMNIQTKIANALDKAQELVDSRKVQIEKYDELLQSVFLDIFGDPVTNSKEWGVKTFKEGINLIKYGTSTPPIFSEKGTPFIRATNIKNGRISKKNMFYISEEEGLKIKKCKLELGDLLIVRSGANTGDTTYTSKEYIGAFGGYDLIVKLRKNLNYIFINGLFNSIYRNIIIDPLTRRAGQPHLNATQIENLKIYFPPLELQNQFASIVETVESEKKKIEESLVELENNFNSLMQRAFRGELF